MFNDFHLLWCHLNVVLPNWMISIQIKHSNSISFTPIDIWFNFYCAIGTSMRPRNMNTVFIS